MIGRMTKGVRTRTRPFKPPEPAKTRKAQGTRARLLAVAADLFVELGYTAVSMRDIAEHARLTHGGVYGHFRSKGQLLVEVIRWKIAEREQSPEFMAAVNDPSRSAGLLADPSGRDIRLLYVDAAAASRHDPDVAAGIAELFAERREAILDAIHDDVSDAEAAASVIFIIETGLAVAEAIPMQPPAERFLPTLESALMALTIQEGDADDTPGATP